MFDLNAAVGRDGRGGGQAAADASALRGVMDYYGVQQALVYHMAARQVHPLDGNRLLTEAVAGCDRLVCCWVALPGGHETGGGVSDFVRDLNDAGVRAVRLFPSTFRFPVNVMVLGDLFERLQAESVPVLIDWEIDHWAQQPVDWGALDEVCSRFGGLAIVLVGMTVGQTRAMMPVLGRHENLHVETSDWQLPDGPAWLAERIGAHRVLLGSGLPFRESGMPIEALARGSLRDEERAAVAGGNARRLLGLSDAPHLAPASPGAEPVFDAHVHLGKWASTYIWEDDAAGIVRQMDRCGIARAALVDFLACGGEDEIGNRRVAEAVRRFPDRLVGYATVSPHHPRPDRLLARCVDEYGFRGLKIHCELHGCQLASDRYTPHWEFAHARALPVLCHVSADHRGLGRLLERCPGMRFLHAHSGAFYRPETGEETIALARNHPNYHADLAGSPHQRGALELLVAQIGADRVLFGSDAMLFDFAYQRGRVTGASLDADQKRLILHDNAARLFGGP